MSSRRSLAELTLDWCAGEVLPKGSPRSPHSEREALARASRDGMRVAGVALLQAAAAEFDSRDIASLGSIAAVIEDDDAIAGLEETLTKTSTQPIGTPRERGEFVGDQFKEWLAKRLVNDLPPKMQGWLKRGWPDPRVRGGMMTFYQAFCGAVQRAVRQDQAAWDDRMKNTGVEAATWRQWLIREADTGIQAESRSAGKKTIKALAIAMIIAAVISGAAWYWWKEIDTRLQALREKDRQPPGSTEVAPASPNRSEISPVTPSPAPEPKSALQTQPKEDVTPSIPDPPIAPETPAEQPRVTLRRDPLKEAARLMDEAERTLSSDHPEIGDRPARTAQDVLSLRIPSHDAQLAENMIRVGQYWEQRNDWAEAARVYQAAVKAYEKTPAENTNPQLQAVNRWAGALRHTGRNTEAEKLYRMLLQAYEGMGSELRPEAATVAHNLGNVLFATGRLRDAREAYGLALKLVADQQSNPGTAPLFDRFKESYIECLRKLGISQSQIDADLRQTLGPKISPKAPSRR